MMKYKNLIPNSEYVEFGQSPQRTWYDKVFIFALPTGQPIQFYTNRTKKFYIMTICETYPVSNQYSQIFDKYDNILTPSIFCKNIFTKQFPTSNVQILRHYAEPKEWVHVPLSPYVFYTIGNIIDPRKNINMLLEAFIRCQFPRGTAKLLLKATCLKEVKMNIPDVEIINGLLTDDQLEEQVHNKSHCYVNCSHSEGVGMGAVEAALRGKPVIITDFGGLQEYIDTDMVIETSLTKVGVHDFLFEPDMVWGQPSLDQLIVYMKKCFHEHRIYKKHEYTKYLVQNVLQEFDNLKPTTSRVEEAYDGRKTSNI